MIRDWCSLVGDSGRPTRLSPTQDGHLFVQRFPPLCPRCIFFLHCQETSRRDESRKGREEKRRTIIALTRVLPPSAKEPAVCARDGEENAASHNVSKERGGRSMGVEGKEGRIKRVVAVERCQPDLVSLNCSQDPLHPGYYLLPPVCRARLICSDCSTVCSFLPHGANY